MTAIMTILLSSFLICQSTNQDSLFFSDKHQKEILDPIPIKYPMYSLLIPGMGQYQLYKKIHYKFN